MDRDTIREINAERLGGWAVRLVDRHATPAVLIGIGHDHASGQMQLCTTEDTPLAAVRAWLTWAIGAIDAAQYEEEHGGGPAQSDNGISHGGPT